MDGLEFRILGPLEVRRDGVAVPVEAAHQRAILATLLVHANRVVAVDRLVEVLWGEAPPASARPTLLTLVSRLRRRLAPAPDQSAALLQTRSPGYLLRVAPERLDMHRFEELLRQGRAALAGADAARAAELLDAAVGLWRGPALADVTAEALVRVERPRLAELRLQAIEERAEARLRLGRQVELLGELRGLVAEHPLRERPYGQLMRALSRSGRQAEALETYQSLRRLLTEELGIEPGTEIQQLHRAVLRGESGPASSPADPPPVPAGPAAAPRRHPPPAQLPADVAAFTGRAEQLAALDRLAAPPPGPAAPVVAVVGTAGAGKTALAIHWSHRVRDRFPDGQLYVDLNGYAEAPPLLPAEVLARFLRALGVSAEQVPTDLQEAAGRYRTELADRRVLVVLDNARDADQVRPLLPGSAGCLVLVTSRDRLDGLAAQQGAVRLPLGALPAAEAHDLLARTLGPDRVAAEPDAVGELARLCTYLPLALRIAAANLAGRPHHRVAEYTARLRAGDPLPALAAVGDDRTAVRAAFALSYAAMPAAAARLFRLLGLLPGTDLPTEAAAAMAGTEIGETGRLLDRLAAAHLVYETASDRFGSHDLLRHYAAELVEAEPAGDRTAALGRLYDWYLATADAAARLLYPEKLRLPPPDRTGGTEVAAAPAPSAAPALPGSRWDNPAQALSWLDAERHNLVLAAQHAAAHGPRPAAWRLADALRGYLFIRMHMPGWQAIARAGRSAAEAEGDLFGQAAVQLGEGEARWRQQRYPAAIDHFGQAAGLSERAGWTEGLASALANLGTVFQYSGRREEAAEHYDRALQLLRRTGQVHGQSSVLNNLGNTSWELGRLDEAADYYLQALELCRTAESRNARAMILNNVGQVYVDLGRLEVAQPYLTESLTLNQQTGNRASEAETLRTLAELHCAAGRTEPALELAQTALALARETGDQLYEAVALNTLAIVHRKTGHPHRALGGHQGALRLSRRVGYLILEAQAHLELALSYRALGHSGPAVSHASQALTIARDQGYRRVEEAAAAALAALTALAELPGPT
jgi:DNA-binding SARP family transcriptional activator